MHAARLDRSPRLQRLHAALADGGWHSTWELVVATQLPNVATYVSELRAGGAEIECVQSVSVRGERIWRYRMTRPAA